MVEKACRWVNRWKEIQWRVGEFPLIRDRITNYHINNYWEDKGIEFPDDSNCLICFWKAVQQLRKNFETSPPIMYWAAIAEDMQGNTFKDNMNLFQISKLPIQLDFIYGTGSGCQAGCCTD